MEQDNPLSLIEVPPEDQMGPAMRQLNERQRRFVCALAVFGGDQRQAYLHAGYSVQTPGAIQACASRLSNTALVVEAIREESLRRINSATLLAVSTMVELASPLNNPDKRLRLKAAEEILNRTGFHGTSEQRIVIKDDRTVAELVEFIKANASLAGMNAAQLLGQKPAAVDAEFTVVDPNDLSDIL